jgi:hypothetical protein
MSYEVQKAMGLLAQRIDTKVRQLEEDLGAKSARSFDEYKEVCGVITGLLTARTFMSDLTHEMEDLDE